MSGLTFRSMKSQNSLLFLFSILLFSAAHAGCEHCAHRAECEAEASKVQVFAEDSGWCWFQDPRAIVHEEYLFIGAVKGNGDGEALIHVYDLTKQEPLARVVAMAGFDHDDHNSPAFLKRKDGSVLAMFARHSVDKFHHYRISDPNDFTKWGRVVNVDQSDFLTKSEDKVTYMNLFRMDAEGKVYNFFRGVDFNPSFVVSKDDGLTWGGGRHFIRSEIKGRHRPYARYAGNGVDTVHVTFTDAHPRQFGNSIYYAAFRGGKFYRADGTFIKDLEKEGPLKPSEAELIFKGSGEMGEGKWDTSAQGSAWVSDIQYDANGYPVIAYSFHITDDDHRYRLAHWDGRQWVDREIAYAGTCLYSNETSYTGLVSLDPVDPTFVVIAADVDPSTGQQLSGHYEIYSAHIGADDAVDSIEWKAITADSDEENLRPMVLREGCKRILLWNRGRYDSYTDYDLDAVGMIDCVNR